MNAPELSVAENEFRSADADVASGLVTLAVKESLQGSSHWARGFFLGVAILVIVIVAIGSAFLVTYVPHTSTSLQTTSTSYQVDALAVISGVMQLNPGGYVASTSGALRPSTQGALSAAYSVLGQPYSTANVTVIVFSQDSSAQSYFNRFTSNVRGLPGYTNISSAINGYQQYGGCYGYGEDVNGIAVAVGICTKGNVFLEVHITSSNDFSIVQSDLTTLMAAAYNSVG